MAAIHSALRFALQIVAGARYGASVLADLNIYGATFGMLRGLFNTLGVTTI